MTGSVLASLDTAFFARVRSRPHKLRVLISQNGPAYLDEECPITIKVTNTDSKELEVTFDVILHPPEDDYSGIVCWPRSSSGSSPLTSCVQ
jgi:hypothetical protein